MVFVLALFFVSCLAVSSIAPVQREWLPVPGGQRLHRSCVHEVPSGSSVSEANGRLRVVFPDGLARLMPKCRHAPRVDFQQFATKHKTTSSVTSPVTTHHQNAARQSIPDGWQVGVNFVTSNGLSYLQNKWNTPPKPVQNVSQTIFIFNSLNTDLSNNNGIAAIIQPVLQYGPSAAGEQGNTWSLASWYVNGAGDAVFSSLLAIGVGQTTLGTISYDPKKPQTAWTITSQIVETGKSTVLHYTTQRRHIYDTAFLTLEVYASAETETFDCKQDYPAAPCKFWDMSAKDSNANPVTITTSMLQQCGPDCTPACNSYATIQNTNVTIFFN